MDVLPWQQIPQEMQALGLTAADGMTQAWFAQPNGRVSGGAAAINEALHYIWWAKPLAYLYHIPGIQQLEDIIYHWVAQNRYRLPGSTATCRLPND